MPWMAWHSSGVGNGGGPGENAEGANGGQPLGTEYTLQGTSGPGFHQKAVLSLRSLQVVACLLTQFCYR